MSLEATLSEQTAAGEGGRDATLAELEQIAGFALRIAQLTAFEQLFSLATPGGSRLSEQTVLFAISRNPGIRQGVLADLLKIKWPNMTKLVRSLEEEGLVERHIPRNDRRAVELRLTEDGAQACASFADDMRRRDRQALSMLDDGEYAQLLTLCRKIAGWKAGQGEKRNVQ